MKLSILILTHQRPRLFSRCLKSVLGQVTEDVEILVNNDSRDIIEINHPQVQYFYESFDNLSAIYKYLLDRSKGEWVYYLEDDDYLHPLFLKIPLTSDLIVGNYYPTYQTDRVLKCMCMYQNEQVQFEQFLSKIDLFNLQLSQHIFRRSTIYNFDFLNDNNVHNDIRLVLYSAQRSRQIQLLKDVFYFQTIDGGDNISFPRADNLLNIERSLDFLNEYGLQASTSYTARPRSPKYTLG